jgi:hypothetical protein
MKRMILTLGLLATLPLLMGADDPRIAASNLLWPDGIKDNPITYDKQDIMRTYDYGQHHCFTRVGSR